MLSERKLSTGIGGMDALLMGGIPSKKNLLIYSAPFIGKEEFVYRTCIECLKRQIPLIYVSTDVPSTGVEEELGRYQKDISVFEKSGLIRYIDTYSMSIDAEIDNLYTEYVSSTMDMSAINLAINRSLQQVISKHAHRLFVFDSLSTMIASASTQAAFRFIQILKGRMKATGTTSIFTMGMHMHPESDVQLFKHLMDGAIEMKEDEREARTYLRVQGLTEVKTRNWIEYSYEKGFNIIGTYGTGRIR